MPQTGQVTLPDVGLAGRMLCTAFLMLGILLPCPGSCIAQNRRMTNETTIGSKSKVAVAAARQDFETLCSSCHGLDGRGGEHAPNISTNPALQRNSDLEIFRIIHDGISAKGMPAFDSLTGQQIKALVSYLRSMAGSSSWDSLSGSPFRGKELFFGKAECGQCHVMRGKGGFLGSDLTEYAASHAAGEAREAILNPGKLRVPHQQMVAIVMRGGERVSGVVRNEDNFSLQLLGEDGTLHMLLKSDIEQLDRNDNPIMPADYGTRLTRSELEDLVSYLAQGTRGLKRQATKIIHKGNQ